MPDERLSMAEQLSGAWDKMEKDDAGHGGEAPEAIEPTPSIEAERAPVDRAEDRPRDESGKFIKADDKPREKLTLKPKEPKDATAKQERAEEGKAPAEQGPDTVPAGVAEDIGKQRADERAAGPVLPPQHWNGQTKVSWEKLPYPVKQALTAEYAQVADLRNLAPVLEPLKQRLTQEFGGVDRGLTAILSTWQFARQQPIDFVKQFVHQFGIDPQSLGIGAVHQQQQPGASQEQQFVDPTVAALQQRLAAIEDASRRDAEQRAAQQQNQITADLQAFGNEVDKSTGSLAHPYFNDVSRAMGALMSSGLATAPQTLKDAYEQACWAVPTIRAELQREAERKAADQRKQAVAKAQKAGGSVTGSPGVARAETHVKQSARADLLKNWDALEARV